MHAYVIVDMTVTDPVASEDYRALAGASVAAAGGTFLARGGRTEMLDGDRDPQRVVLIRFDSLEQAKQWRSSPEYGKATRIRDRAARTRMIVVEGMA